MAMKRPTRRPYFRRPGGRMARDGHDERSVLRPITVIARSAASCADQVMFQVRSTARTRLAAARSQSPHAPPRRRSRPARRRMSGRPGRAMTSGSCPSLTLAVRDTPRRARRAIRGRSRGATRARERGRHLRRMLPGGAARDRWLEPQPNGPNVRGRQPVVLASPRARQTD
jgi:hypothetical protein